MKEAFSRGSIVSKALVFRVSEEQKLLFPRADLVRIEGSIDKNWAAKLFYRHEIASLLFPNNFIEVIAAQVDPWDDGLLESSFLDSQEFKKAKEREHRLFSKIAEVSSDHATFSSHMNFGTSGDEIIKLSNHNCEGCKIHRKFHKSKNLEKEATKVALDMQKIGINPPINDPSDYCLNAERNIVFFEIDEFDGDKLHKYLSSLVTPNENEKKALSLLRRFISLREDSKARFKKNFLNGVAGSIKLN